MLAVIASNKWFSSEVLSEPAPGFSSEGIAYSQSDANSSEAFSTILCMRVNVVVNFWEGELLTKDSQAQS